MINRLIFIFIINTIVSISSFSQNLLPYVPYQGMTKEIKTDHFVIIFPEKYGKKALKIASYAEEIHSYLARFMQWNPWGRTQIVLSDNTDMPNGSGIPSPRNTILLYLAPAELTETLKSQNDPLYSIIVHEYTHILHLDQIRGGAWFWRVMNGRLYFPVSNSFSWYFEGVAVLNESRFTDGGRSFSSYTNALVRDAALNNAIPSFDKVVNPIVDWPNNREAYHYGARFMEYLYSHYGKEKYDEVFINSSKEFFPFIFRFAMSFQKLYGKKLGVLWNEWIEYEKENAKLYIPEKNDQKLTNLEGEILTFAPVGEDVFISSYSYKNDKYLYRLGPDGKLEKLVNGYIRSVSGTSDKNVIIYTKYTPYLDDFDSFDVYSFDLQTRIEKKLTIMQRINYVSFSNSGEKGVMVSHNGLGSRLILVDFTKGKLTGQKEVIIPENVRFIDQPSINISGTEVVFSARINTGEFKIFRMNVSDNEINEIKGISGMEAKFANDNEISFITFDESTDNTFIYDLNSKDSYKVLKSPNCVLHQKISGDKIYYVDETYKGEELFADYIKEKTGYKFKISSITMPLITDVSDDNAEKNETNNKYKIKSYNVFRSLYPQIWAFLPYQMKNSFLAVPVNNNFLMIPFFAPKFMIYNTTALGRFSYTASIGIDYLRYYPDNELTFNLKLPGFDIDYSWSNYAGGQKLLYNWQIYDEKYNGRSPVVFSNKLSLNTTLPLAGYGNLIFQAGVAHHFEEYDFEKNKLTNTFTFFQQAGYYYISSRLKSSRWDRGIYFNLMSYISPENLLDNTTYYLLRGSIEGRVPFYNTFFFMLLEGGGEVTGKNYFSANTSILNFSENLLGTGGSSSITDIDTKAFPKELIRTSSGSAFFSTDFGFDVTLYKRSHYWHFATLGFKEVYIRAYNEFVFLYNERLNTEIYRGIMFDAVFELGVDLFVAYGNMTVGCVAGGAIGYRAGDQLPAWGVYGAVKFKLGY